MANPPGKNMIARRFRGLALIVALLTCGVLRSATAASQVSSASAFADQIAALSERGGYFDTDNLISNESSYLQVLPELRRREVRGGAYVGVGPDQNFSYIAQIQPSIAFIVDIRRDNLLLHLLFKALFSLSRTRVEYLAQLLGRPVPPDAQRWRHATIERLISYVDAAPPSQTTVNALRARVDENIRRFGVPLWQQDFATLDRFHRRFIAEGLSLRFQSTGRPPQSYYPTYRQLLSDRDPSGGQGNYLASEEAFAFVKQLEARDLVIPVVGDVSGPSAVAAIGRLLSARRERLSAFYISNVEFYLFGEGAFPRFVANLGAVPRHHNSVVIRSVFGRFALGGLRPGDGSVSRVQPVQDLLAEFSGGRIQRYMDLVSR